MRVLCRTKALVCSLVFPVFAGLGTAQVSHAQAAPQRVIRSAADLPPRNYSLAVAPSVMVRTGEGFQAFADAVRKDDEDLLRADIRDNTVRLNLEYDLADLDLLAGNREAMQARLARIDALEEKPAEKLTATLFARAYANTWTSVREDSPKFPAALQAEYARLVSAVPWDIAAAALKQGRASLEFQTPALLIASIQGAADPPWRKTGTVDAPTASWLLIARTSILKRFPYTDMRVTVLTATINAHRSTKPEIWTAREAQLPAESKLTPVVLGIWDTGVDRALYKDQLDGKLSDPVPTLDYPFTATTDLGPRTPEQVRLWPEQVKLMQGAADLEGGIASPQADAYTAMLRSLPPEQLVPVADQMSFSSQYMHGTHVAGIALRANPAARLYVLRETLWWGNVPRVPSVEEQRAIAARYQQVFADFEKHHVRVVNLSWYGSVAVFEGGLKANGRCTTAEDCRAKGTELNNIQRDALQAAMAANPGILFVCIAGNADQNNTFNDVFPGSFTLPNVLTVGAVDGAGDETPFTSFGPTVRLYANGDQVESYLPGGQTLRASGTSMAAPQVTNAAGKLLAVDPTLRPEQVVDLLLRGSDASADGRLRLLNPAKSMALLTARQQQGNAARGNAPSPTAKKSP